MITTAKRSRLIQRLYPETSSTTVKAYYYGLFFSEETKTWTAAMDHKPSSIWTKTYQNAIRKTNLHQLLLSWSPLFWDHDDWSHHNFAGPLPCQFQWTHSGTKAYAGDLGFPTGSTEDKKPTEVGKMWEVWGGCLDDHSCLTDVVNSHGDRKSPKDRVVGPLPNGLFLACKKGWS